MGINTEHLGLAVVDPFMEEEVGKFKIFFFILKAFNDHCLDEMSPIGNAFNQPIFFFEELILLHD